MAPGRSGSSRAAARRLPPGLALAAAGEPPGSADKGGAADGKKARGRPRKDLSVEVGGIEQQLVKAPSNDTVWWGAEAKVQVKTLQTLLKDIGTRLKSSTDMEEINTLGMLQKKVTSIVMVVDAVRQHGLESDDFRDIFDLISTRLHLEPKVNLQWPPTCCTTGTR